MRIGILGSGTWGTALARLLYKNGNQVTVWSPIPDEISLLSSQHIHKNLSGIDIPKGIKFTLNLKDCCIDKDVIFFAVPSVFIRETASKIRDFIHEDQIIVNVSKGIEDDTLLTLSKVISDELKNTRNLKIVALSGPTHAEEVACELPSVIVAASESLETAQLIQKLVSNDYMRVYTNVDIEGVELCGALKNVVALAVGISDGIGFGDNAKAAIITRGITEVARLGIAMNCNETTFYGLTGIGDLIVTATSKHSRNNKAGRLIGKGLTLDEAKKEVGMVIEGINTLPAAVKLAKKYNIDMPIIFMVNDIIFHGFSPRDASKQLITREMKNE